MYLRDQAVGPQMSGWTLTGFGQPRALGKAVQARASAQVRASTNLLNAAALANAIAENRRWGEQLGWKNLYVPISLYHLRFRDRVPRAAEFAQAVARWQQAAGNVGAPTGILDRTTWQAMRPRGEPNAFTTSAGLVRPSSFNEVLATFGDPRPNPTKWEIANIVKANAPTGFQFKLAGAGSSTSVRVHRLVKTHFEALFQTIANAGLWDDIQPVSGPFAARNIRGGTQLSMHAFGLAIDVIPTWYPRGPGSYSAFPIPRVVQVFQDYGFHWGIFFSTPDPMHFQFATGA